MTVTVLNNQSLLDISVQATGSALNYLLIAQANDIIPTDEIIAGTELIIPDGLVNDEDVLRYYQANGILPATALTQVQKDETDGCEGIGCWAIGVDFIVS